MKFFMSSISNKCVKETVNSFANVMIAGGSIKALSDLYLNNFEKKEEFNIVSAYLSLAIALSIYLLNIFTTHPRFEDNTSKYYLTVRYVNKALQILGLHNFILQLQEKIISESCASLQNNQQALFTCEDDDKTPAHAVCCISKDNGNVYIVDPLFYTLAIISLLLSILNDHGLRANLKLYVQSLMRKMIKREVEQNKLNEKERGVGSKIYDVCLGSITNPSLTHGCIMLIEKIIGYMAAKDIAQTKGGVITRYTADAGTFIYTVVQHWRKAPASATMNSKWLEQDLPAFTQCMLALLMTEDIVKEVIKQQQPHQAILTAGFSLIGIGCLFSSLITYVFKRGYDQNINERDRLITKIKSLRGDKTPTLFSQPEINTAINQEILSNQSRMASMT